MAMAYARPQNLHVREDRGLPVRRGFLPLARAHPKKILMIRIANAQFWLHD
jgi:hypothetical protein